MNTTEHIVACIGEEAGEIAQLAGKILRFGMHDAHEKTGNVPNIELLVTEVNELLGLMDMLGQLGYDIHRIGSRAEKFKKRQRVERYMDYAWERGTLEK